MSAIPAIPATPAYFFWILAVALGVFPLSLLILKLVSLLGWTRRARENPTPDGIFPERYATVLSFQSGWFFMPVGYNNCLRVRVAEDGLFVRPFPPFDFSHPWIFLPWTLLANVKKKSAFGISYTIAEFRSQQGTRFHLTLPENPSAILPPPTENA